MSPSDFIAKWRATDLKERSAAQEHFIDLCRLLREPTPAEADPAGEYYCFERGALKDTGGEGWADAWKRHHFAWEYKGKRANLDQAFVQLRQYALALENPPLLVVSDMERIRLRTNWTNSVSTLYEFGLEDLADADVRQKLKWAFSAPERLRPGETRQVLTERAAAAFAELATVLRKRGHPPLSVARFVNRLVFCMFAEDADLLPNKMFTRMLEYGWQRPDEFPALSGDLFRAMAAGGRVGFERVPWFDGRLFEDDATLPLERAETEMVLRVAALDWAEIDPSILGTLFERGLDPGKRSQLGAHYTDRDKIMLIVGPVVTQPWLAEWEGTKEGIEACLRRAEQSALASAKSRLHKQAEQRLQSFLARLRAFRVLDPACGSGNFLYLALQALKDLEHRVQLEAEALGLQRTFPEVGPANVRGIEINPYAAELARVSVWIGEIQWMRRNGFSESRDPVLKPLDTIECRDAVMTPEGGEPEWPEADVVIGNPPFLGDRVMRGVLGHEYTEALRQLYGGALPQSSDLVCYWFHKAGQLMNQGRIARAGLVATNSIRGGKNRVVLDRIVERNQIFNAWADQPWVVEGASVRVSLICFAPRGAGYAFALDGTPAKSIHPDLVGRALDLTGVTRLSRNQAVAFLGIYKNGPFDIPGDLAREWLRLPANPNGKSNSSVLRPRVNGMDITRRPSGTWIIDFGLEMSESEASLYEAPFAHAVRHIKPERAQRRRTRHRIFWWRHGETRPGMRRAISGLSRYIATPTLAKHRVFVWIDVRICPDHQLIVIARDDDTTFGILQSRFHELWSLNLGTSFGETPRYTPSTTFETFPFPTGLSPDVPAAACANNPDAVAVAAAARRLDSLRRRWVNPPEWVEWVAEPVPGYPKRAVSRSASAAKALRERTLTKLYNTRPQWLAEAHANLDAAVAAAYGWPPSLSDDEVLANLLELNLRRGGAGNC